VAVLLCSALVVPFLGAAPPAGAAGRGQAIGTEAAASGTWGATLSAASFTFTTNTYQTSTVTNSGTIGLSGISYKVVVSASTGASLKVFVCTVAWVATKCSGGAGTQVGGTLAQGTTTTITSTVVPPIGGAVYLQLEPTGVIHPTTVTLSTLIASTQLRAAVVTNH
jgi:hypothetical protein